MKGKNWSMIDMIVSLISSLLAIFGIYTSIKASNYNDEQADLRLEKKYGLTPVEEETEE